MVLTIKEAFQKVELFEESMYGKKLASDIRFSLFKPESVSNEDWVKLLGADVNNLKHMKLMYGFCKSMLDNSSDIFSEEERNILLVTALFHDWAEAVVGDIPSPIKTEEDEKIEKQILIDIFNKFAVNNYEEILEVIFEKESNLGKVWKSIEVLAYVRTSLIAWRKRYLLDETVLPDLEKMSFKVLFGNFAGLVKTDLVFNHVVNFFKFNKKIISEIFEKYEELNSSNQEKDLEIYGYYLSAKESWEEFNDKYLN